MMRWSFRRANFGSHELTDPTFLELTDPILEHLEECIANVRSSEPKDLAMALDGLAFVAGAVMDDASKEWERLIGRKWERYVD